MTALPNGPWRQQQELDLQFTLGRALTITQSFSAAETVRTLGRARALAEELDQPEYMLRLMVNQLGVHFTRAEARLALSLAKQIESMRESRNNGALKGLGRLLQGISWFCIGDLVAAHGLLEEHADRACVRTSPQPAHWHQFGMVHAGRALALLGHVDQARARLERFPIPLNREGFPNRL